MRDGQEAMCYHGRRSVDELAGALNAKAAKAASLHKELSLMHLERFVAMVTSAADCVNDGSSARADGTAARPDLD